MTVCTLGLFFPPSLHAIDLGIGMEGEDKPKKVEITNTPLPVTSQKSELKIITPDSGVDLEYNGIYQSPYLAVSGFRQVVFYVKPIKVLNDLEKNLEIRYQLDAFFAAEPDLTGTRDFGASLTQFDQPGWQQFGILLSPPQKETPEIPSYVKTSTGETSARVLYVPIYGPYVRLELRNRTPGDKRRFSVTAYLIR